MRRSLLVLLVVSLCLTLVPASSWASAITIDPLTTPQTLLAPGCDLVGGICIPPDQTTFASAVTGPGILGGARVMTLSNTLPGNFFDLYGSVGGGRARLEGPTRGSMLLEWDANGAGLDLDLSDMMGLTIGRFSSDGGFTFLVNLLSLHDSKFVFSASLDDASAIGDLPNLPLHSYRVGTYSFDRFEAIGNPNLRHISAIQIEVVTSSGVAGIIGDLSFAPTPVPEGGSTIIFLSLGLAIALLWRHTLS